jgi:hypothetical protein
VDNWKNIPKIVSGKNVLEEHSVFSNCHIIGLDTGGLVFLVSAITQTRQTNTFRLKLTGCFPVSHIFNFNQKVTPRCSFCLVCLVCVVKKMSKNVQQLPTKTRLKILPVLTREHYTSLLHWV